MSAGSGPVRVALVNDYEIVVAGIAAVLAPYSSRVDVVELDSRLPPLSDVDVVLYDSFGQAQGEEVDVQGLVGDCRARVVMFSWNLDPEVIQGALKVGAVGYLSKGLAAEDLVTSLERIHRGERVTPLDEPMPEGDGFGHWPGDELGLSAREAEILALITQGMANQEICQRLYLSPNTVKTYIRTLYRKIGVTRRAQAVVFGYEHGFRPDRIRSVTED